MTQEEDTLFETVWETNQKVEASVVVALLEEEGLTVEVTGMALTAAHIGLGEHSVMQQIRVPVEDAERARELIAESTHIDEAELDKASQEPPKTPLARAKKTTLAPLNQGSLELRAVKGSSVGFVFALQAPLLYMLTVFQHAMSQGQIDGGKVLARLGLSVIAGLIVGVLVAWIYNLCAQFVGGLVFETQDNSKLLTTDFELNQCFYRDDEGVIHGPMSRDQLTEKIQASELSPLTLVQIEEYVFFAGQLPL